MTRALVSDVTDRLVQRVAWKFQMNMERLLQSSKKELRGKKVEAQKKLSKKRKAHETKQMRAKEIPSKSKGEKGNADEGRMIQHGGEYDEEVKCENKKQHKDKKREEKDKEKEIG